MTEEHEPVDQVRSDESSSTSAESLREAPNGGRKERSTRSFLELVGGL